MGPVGWTQGGPGACWSPGGAYQRQGAPSDTGAGHVPYMTHPSAPGQVGGGTEEPGTLSKGSTSGAVGSRLLWASESLALSRSLSRRGVGQAWAARAHPSRVPRVLPDPDFRPQPPQEDVVCCGSCQDLAAGAGWGGGGTRAPPPQAPGPSPQGGGGGGAGGGEGRAGGGGGGGGGAPGGSWGH